MRLFTFAWLLQTTLAVTSPLDLCTPDLPYQRFHVRILFLCIRGAASDLLVQQLDHLRTDVLQCRDDFCLVNNLCLRGQLAANLMRELQCLAQFCTTPSENELVEQDFGTNNTDIVHCRNRILI
ncbi:uncharacterized protein LOC119386751 isoform X2 [Rhipicephalus sanguineus]|uniref:uncharacterized protein LOC119386751 isoform X2 n=1 Tax=Rhipicephalus sanguineus TaxID=34632 RepID=UPI0020C283E7|nr:uncharacterized protein LOC119386751 isoform X2 [Rhipicephalus sanguineus]